MNQSEELNRIKIYIDTERAKEAKKMFLELEPEETVDYFMVKGQLEQKFQNWGEAINAYNKVLDFDAKNEEAKNNLHLIQNILNFWNPDMFNP